MSEREGKDVTIAAIEAKLAEREATIADFKQASAKENDEICQLLGKAMGYPWFKDDQKNFPGSTEEHGVCVGEHVAVTLAMEAEKTIAEQGAKLAAATRYQFGNVTIRYESDVKKWMVWNGFESLSDDWLDSFDEAYQAALAAGWLEQTQQPT